MRNILPGVLLVMIGSIQFFETSQTGAAEPAESGITAVEEVVSGAKHDYSVLKQNQWTMTNTKWATTVFKGKKAMRLEGWRAMATIKDMAFEDGTIEMDIAAGGAGKFYIGVAFRVQNEINRNFNDEDKNDNYQQLFENIIFRPFRSGTPYAVQYAASGTKYSWKYLRNKHPGKYEGKASYSKTGWFHVRIEVAGQQAQVFVDNAKTPALVVNDLKHGRLRGSVGITSVLNTAYFANVTVTKRKPKKIRPAGAAVDADGEEVVSGAKQDFSVLKQNQWTMTNGKWATTLFKGKKAMRLDGWRPMATLKDIEFEDGTIEMDIAAGDKGQFFIGVAFRVQDKINRKLKDKENYNQLFENVIFRPFRSGTPRAVQYAAAGTKYSWKYLRDNHPGKYEGKADLSETGWFHVRIEVAGQQAQVFVDNAKTPALVVNDLKHGRSKGSVGITSVWKTAYFANVTVTKRERVIK